ncbi:hypothetical protein P5673_023979 [Acropora cervicornis]|uniref:Uncharacterized protein n=1 Tax=Acropora cervicornis TaxID=6130 RepID=A0AAD9Q4B9_ACRCE|nr:hypothetical protein P5673_023979 [Acropora cervicornis]
MLVPSSSRPRNSSCQTGVRIQSSDTISFGPNRCTVCCHTNRDSLLNEIPSSNDSPLQMSG